MIESQMGPTNSGDSKTSSHSPPHICIVGAGIAGLRCAAVLQKHNIRVTILEARNRVGGRVCQSDVLGYPVDLGPQWIHTSGTNPILSIATKTKTPLHVWNHNINLYDFEGNLLSNEKAVQLDELRWHIIESAMQYSRDHETQVSEDDSLYDFVLRRGRELLHNDHDRDLFLGMAQMWGNYTGDPIERQSLKYAWMEECCGGEEVIVASSYREILDDVKREALSASDLKLDTKVIRVESIDDADVARKIRLTTTDGSRHVFDGVVMTTPLGWLKHNLPVFVPSLSPRLRTAIDSISVGHLEKVYITFPRAFWQEEQDERSDGGLGSDALRPVTLKQREDFPGYSNWIAPRYAESTNPHRWPQEAYNLAAFPEPHRHPTLLFYLYGEQSAYITDVVDAMSESERLEFLQSFFHPYFSRLPHYNDTDPECQPKAILSTSWSKDELAGYGSYCNFQVGMTDARGDVETLRAGCPDRRLWFAGEHTAPFHEMGTATGAYLSGEAVAERVVDALGSLAKATPDGASRMAVPERALQHPAPYDSTLRVARA